MGPRRLPALGIGSSREGPPLQGRKGPRCQSTSIQKIKAMVNTVPDLRTRSCARCSGCADGGLLDQPVSSPGIWLHGLFSQLDRLEVGGQDAGQRSDTGFKCLAHKVRLGALARDALGSTCGLLGSVRPQCDVCQVWNSVFPGGCALGGVGWFPEGRGSAGWGEGPQHEG